MCWYTRGRWASCLLLHLSDRKEEKRGKVKADCRFPVKEKMRVHVLYERLIRRSTYEREERKRGREGRKGKFGQRGRWMGLGGCEY